MASSKTTRPRVTENRRFPTRRPSRKSSPLARPTGTTYLAAFSSVGPEVELAAPGTDVLSTALPINIYSNVEEPFNRYIELSGTSFAAPHVAGAGALLMSDVGLSNVEARERLRETAADVGLREDEQGYGRLDVAAALGVE